MQTIEDLKKRLDDAKLRGEKALKEYQKAVALGAHPRGPAHARYLGEMRSANNALNKIRRDIAKLEF